VAKREHKAAKNRVFSPRHFRFAGPCRGTFQSAREREREREREKTARLPLALHISRAFVLLVV